MARCGSVVSPVTDPCTRPLLFRLWFGLFSSIMISCGSFRHVIVWFAILYADILWMSHPVFIKILLQLLQIPPERFLILPKFLYDLFLLFYLPGKIVNDLLRVWTSVGCFIHYIIIMHSLYMDISVRNADSDGLQITELLRIPGK